MKRSFSTKTLRGIAGAVVARGGRVIVDGGCGAGVQACAVANACPTSTVYGYDVSSADIDRATRHAARHGYTNVSFSVASHDTFTLPAASGGFVDLWYTSNSLVGKDERYNGAGLFSDNAACIERRLRRFHGMLAPGGWYVLIWGATEEIHRCFAETAADYGFRLHDALRGPQYRDFFDAALRVEIPVYEAALVFERS